MPPSRSEVSGPGFGLPGFPQRRFFMSGVADLGLPPNLAWVLLITE